MLTTLTIASGVAVGLKVEEGASMGWPFSGSSAANPERASAVIGSVMIVIKTE